METLTDELVDLIQKSGQKTLTVAVDGPSERMRRVINKQATDDFIVEKCQFLTEKGILHLKIYSIIGLPGETEEDIDHFIALVERVMKTYVATCSQRGNIGQVTIGLSPLIPKPGTPGSCAVQPASGGMKSISSGIRLSVDRRSSTLRMNNAQ